jgi:hypothetical protein
MVLFHQDPLRALDHGITLRRHFMPKCRQCGFEMDANVRYCPNCATKNDTSPQPAADSDVFTDARGESVSEKAARMREQIRGSLDTEINASNHRIKKLLSAHAIRSTSRGITEFGLTMTCEACGGSGHCSSCREWYQRSAEENKCPDCGGTGACTECGGDGSVGDE